jgi:multiple sugar transport system ATP-binding protein
VGELSREAADQTGLPAGTALIVGGADHVLSAFAAGVNKPGDALVKLGGAGDILVASDTRVVDERLYLDAHPVPGHWLPNGCMATSGTAKEPRANALKRADEVAESLGLAKLLDRKPKALSGGQQQRVAIGRAIIREPSVFLFDEPLSNLDAKLRVETRTELLQIQRRLGITCLYVTHDQEEAMTLSDRMVVMRHGRAVQVGTPIEVFNSPVDTFVAAFVGSPKMNLIAGELTGETFTLPSGFALNVGRIGASGPVTIGVRPDDLVPTVADDADAHVKLVELLGPRAIVTVDARDTELTCVVEAARLSGITEGTRVALSARPGAVHAFDTKTGQRLVGADQEKYKTDGNR